MSTNTSLLAGRFRGALIGALVGDCFGAPFEGRLSTPKDLLDKLEAMSKLPEKRLRYTDDSSMTMSVCRSLIRHHGLDPRDMAREFSEAYFQDPKRGYGAAVRTVFKTLKNTNYVEPYGPARDQFDGNGSFGNGAAMRCSGIALFAHKNNYDDQQTGQLVENVSRITHSHIAAINGAAMLVSAIRYVLHLEEESLKEDEFLDHLIKEMSKVEPDQDPVYSKKLKYIKSVIEALSINGTDTTQEQIVAVLGNDVSAQNSVPLAIYSFLRGVSKFTDSFHIDNEFFRTLHWAISCGGDTDTIASMACALCGAYLGIDKIPQELWTKCEAAQEMMALADQLAND